MRGAVLLLAAALAACTSSDCLPPAESAPREELRRRLMGLVHMSQCPGPAMSRRFEERRDRLAEREQAFLARIRASRLAPDLERAIREDQEFSRNVNEADCAMTFWDRPEHPEAIAMYEAGLSADEAAIRDAEAEFERLVQACA
jgi:hypothetical protein